MRLYKATIQAKRNEEVKKAINFKKKMNKSQQLNNKAPSNLVGKILINKAHKRRISKRISKNEKEI